jgi:hypothetical protein
MKYATLQAKKREGSTHVPGVRRVLRGKVVAAIIVIS